MMADNTDDKKLTEAGDYLLEISEAQKRMHEWHLTGDAIIKLYRGEGDDKNRGSDTYKILWQITETQRPVIYSQPPDPSIRRRFLERDDITREAAEILEKSMYYVMECPGHEFATMADGAVSDFLLPGRGQARVVYEVETEDVPTKDAEYDEDGKPSATEPRKVPGTEKVYADYLFWKDFMHSDGRIWEMDVWWVAFGASLTRGQLIKEFGEEIGNKIPLIADMDDSEQSMWSHYEDRDDVARVWEFWNKRTGKVYKVAEGYDEFLETPAEDPLQLLGFFPCPKPLYMVETTANLEPVPEYRQYEDQANSLYRLTQRIAHLEDWAKVQGWYDTALAEEIGRAVHSPEGGLKAMDNFQRMRDAGGAKGVIEWFPIEQIVQALVLLAARHKEVKAEIYELVGLSDIMRGVAKPRVTKGAQQLEAQFAAGRSSRIGRKQRKVEVFLRDIIRIMAEIIAEQFEPETLFEMTGTQSDEETMAGMQEVVELLRDEKMRNYRVDVETSSTVAPDDAREKEELNEFMPAFTQMMSGTFQMVQGGIIDPEMAKEIVMTFVRKYGFGREIEDLLDQGLGQQQEEEGPSPEEQAQQAEMEIKKGELQLKQQKLQMEMRRDIKELALKEAELMLKDKIEEAKILQKEKEAQTRLLTTIINAQGGKG